MFPIGMLLLAMGLYQRAAPQTQVMTSSTRSWTLTRLSSIETEEGWIMQEEETVGINSHRHERPYFYRKHS